MTTISNHSNSLIDPLARTKGGCATTTASDNESKTNNPREEVEDGYDGMMPILGINQEDEEIASIEADGMNQDDNGGTASTMSRSQSRSVAKKILTAALVTSIADAPKTSSKSSDGGDIKRRSNMIHADTDNQLVESETVDKKSIYADRPHASHVTPTTSEASSFSSVETVGDQECPVSSTQKSNGVPQLHPKAPNAIPSSTTINTVAANSRTIYPRASKTAASNKDTSAMTFPVKSNSDKVSSLRDKRKMDTAYSESRPPASKSTHQPPSSSVPNPLAGMDTPSNMPPPPQVSFQYMQYPQIQSSTKNLQPPKESQGTSFSAVAESMSTAQYQTDNLRSASTNELMSSQQGRGRIFSIDLDPAVLDFVESVVDPLGNDSDAPDTNAPRSRNHSVTFDDDVNSHSGRLSFRRDRGFSFEFFSFGIDGDEPLPPIEEGNAADAIKGNRVRGDSIIFDPISFHDGGIHETSALMHVKHEDQSSQDYDSSAAAAAAPHVNHVLPSIIHNPPQVMNPPVFSRQYVQKQPGVASSGKSSAKTTLRPKTSQMKHRSKAKSSNVFVPPQSNSNYRQITITTSSSRNFPQSFTDNTIHMPHGSDAAAAAAAGMTQPNSASSPDGFGGISHTSCPMELLNKGGRIGIYLPEERKARIAKFHDKRKQRMWRKKIKYDCRKKLADSRPRIKGRFVKRSDVDES